MSWVSALKEWNTGKGTWCIPKKGTTEHGEVLAIIERKKRAASPATGATTPAAKTDTDRLRRPRLNDPRKPPPIPARAPTIPAKTA